MHSYARTSVVLAVLGLALLALGVGCKDSNKESAARAATNATTLVALTEKDIAEIERGLPAGAKNLSALWANGSDPRQDLAGVRKALQRVRRDVMDLTVAKSTFFALADDKGVAIRNDLEEDVMAGQNLAALFPAITKSLNGTFVTTIGSFPNSNPKAGLDKDWVAAVGVKKPDGTPGGIFITGWSYRYFARHLSEALKSHLLDEAKATNNEGKIPVFYVALFDKEGVYSAPLTPDVNEKALAQLGLVDKTAGGPYQGTITITDRGFGYAAARISKMAPDTGVVVLRSEI
jgi:hypothetical protein